MPQFSVGEVILNGKYRIDRLLGEGAFGEVYLATHLNLKTLRALKVLRKEGESGVGSTIYGNARRRFLQESKLGSQLGAHPRIIQVMDFDEVEDLLVLALEYAPGGSLQKRLESLREEGKPMPVADALRIAVEVAEGLALLHKMDVVHRDLKPGNILFDKEGHAKVADFGLAQVPHSDSRRSVLSMPEPHPGTPGYMSPEQTRPPYDVLTPASDIYALGAMLFEMLSGRTQYTQRPGTRPSDLRAGVPAALDDLVLRMLSKDPQERPWDGTETARILGEIEQNLAAVSAREAAQAAERTRLAAEENARQIAAEREQARLAAEAQASRAADEEARQQAADREKTRLAAAEQARHAAEEEARKQAPILPVPRKIPWWGWLGGVVLLTLLFFAVRSIALPASPTLAPVIAPTTVPLTSVSVLPACTEVGQTWVSPVDGMTLVCVPAGKFSMGSYGGDEDEKPVHEVYLDAYWMDQTEVTNAQYAQCVAAGECTSPKDTVSSSRYSYYKSESFTDYPVINVDWYQAAAYCAWAGGGLPSESQWEKAARGTEGWKYPWGNTFDGTKVNFADKNNQNFDWSDKNVDDGYADTAPVGSYPQGVSRYGALDMAGNVQEWTADWYGTYPSGEQTNPAGPASGAARVLRGGSWYNNEYNLRSSFRYEYLADGSDHLSGFRCVRSLPSMQNPVVMSTVVIPIPPACTQKGQTWVSPVDGMTLVCVPAGKFTMGSNDGDDDEKPVHEVYLDAYWMDQTEVSNDQFAQFVSKTGYQTDAETAAERAGFSFGYVFTGEVWDMAKGAYWRHPSGPQSNLDGRENHPVVQVSWNDASAYCTWAGRDLPTEAQWEKTARGIEGYQYPWGNTFDGTKLNNAGKNTNFDHSDNNVDDGYADTAPVGSYPQGASPYGALDMAGNVWEWVADYHGMFYLVEQTNNPIGWYYGERRTARGGSWYGNENGQRSSNRDEHEPGDRYYDGGFRCARSSP